MIFLMHAGLQRRVRQVRPAAAQFDSKARVDFLTRIKSGSDGMAMSLASLALIIYVFACTPLKRRGPACIPVGAVSGALPVLVGWAATSAEFGFWRLVTFTVLFLWQIPHFLAIAWWRQGDYSSAGYRILPNHDERGRRTSRWALLSTLAVSAVSLAPSMANRATLGYLAGVLLAGVLFTFISVRFALQRSEASGRLVH